MNNAKEKRLKLVDALAKPAKPVSRQEKQEAERVLTQGEKVQLAIMFEKLNMLETQVQQVRAGVGELITSMVTHRGLDPIAYGVNLAEGMIKPIERNGKEPRTPAPAEAQGH